MPGIQSLISVNGGVNTGLAVEPKYNAARAAIYPLEGDWFMGAWETGNLTTIAANAPLFMMRNLHTTKIFYVARIAIRYFIFTAFTTAQELGLSIFRINNSGTSDSGGTSITVAPRLGLATQNASLFASTSTGLINIATTAQLTAGTKVLDTSALFTKSNILNTVGALILDEIIEINDNNDPTAMFAQNEGFVINNKILLGATGLMRMQVRVRWREI